MLDVRDYVQPRSGLGVYVCCRIRWWHSLRSLTTGYRNNTPDRGIATTHPQTLAHIPHLLILTHNISTSHRHRLTRMLVPS